MEECALTILGRPQSQYPLAMLIGEPMGQGFRFGSRDIAQALHPGTSVFKVLNVLRDTAEILKPVPVGDDVTLTIAATPGTHRAAFVTQFVTQAGPATAELCCLWIWKCREATTWDWAKFAKTTATDGLRRGTEEAAPFGTASLF